MKRQETDGHRARHYRPGRLAAMALLGSAILSGASAANGIRVEVLDSPAPEASLTPFLAASGERLYLSWLSRTAEGHELRMATWDGRRFSDPLAIHASKGFFANWADFASILPFGDGRLAAHWLEKSAEGTYDYDVWISVSPDGGRTWKPPRRPHRDGTSSEHGFVSLAPAGDGFAAVWLDGRSFREGAEDNEMALMFTTFHAGHAGQAGQAGENGSFAPEEAIDSRVCECCQTAMAPAGDGFLVAYRDRSPEEIRDIAFLRGAGGRWSEPARIHADDWHLTGCPVNGPQASSDGRSIALAWFTASRSEPRVQLAFSRDEGESFSEPIRVDDGNALGRVDVELLGDGAIVSWLARSEEKEGEIRARRVLAQGELSEVAVVARTGSDRASGFPRMAVFRSEVFLAWTETGAGGSSRVRLARLVLE